MYASPTVQDMNLPFNTVGLPVTVILDGEVVWDNLKSVGWDESRLMSEIKTSGAGSVNDVLYAEWKEGEALHVQTY
jgi:uncharacterized membrane protein YcaP (DUF421 family)